ncbi:MAG: hypothetical protein KGM24_09810 [Elusimicrobia bacterium]|nr:hypothetical protein [Elusimicrobiota bacterium]
MKRTLPALLLAAALAASCRPKPGAKAAPGPAFLPPAGKRAFSLSIDKSQTRFLRPGDAVEIVILAGATRDDGSAAERSIVLAPRAEVLRLEPDWSDDDGLVQLALTPEQLEYAALAVDREDRVFLDRVASAGRLVRAGTPASPPELAGGARGVAVLVYADQQELLAPGDRVDVVATREDERPAGRSGLTARTLLQDVAVLGAAPPDGDDDWATVELRLTETQAGELRRAVLARDGLTLAIRAPADRATGPVEPTRMSRLIDAAGARVPTKS